MNRYLKALARLRKLSESEISDLRRALLLCEREESRAQGRRKLDRLAGMNHPFISPVAMSGLSSSYFWSGDLRKALFWSRQVIAQYPLSTASVWSATLVVSIYRTLGMRRERFEAEGERFRLMRRIAFQAESVPDRLFALEELVKELEARDLVIDAQRCAQELEDLRGSLFSRQGRLAAEAVT